jgi:beta-glucosidase
MKRKKNVEKKELIMPNATFHFPPNFLWGVATASHQVEGHNTNNQWWAWEQQEGRIQEGHTSGAACNWWENAEADFDRAAAMGLTSLRLSIEWSRVEVSPGRIDMAALDRYREMLQGLRERGIEPMVTLHHFSNPLWVAEQGGWLNTDTLSYFRRYVEQVVRALGEYTTLWCTINEPNVYAYMGYLEGDFPPGKQDPRAAMVVMRNMLKAHAAAYHLIHRLQADARVGLAHNVRIFDPHNPRSPLDRLLARAHDRVFNQALIRAVWQGWWRLPLGVGPAWRLRRTLDWIGLNYYTRDLVAFDPRAADAFFARLSHDPDAEMLDGGYGELYPEGLWRALRRLSRLGLPIYVTENGVPDADDDLRPRALLQHLHQLWRALLGNIPVMGYYHWTLTDNFEWAEGWTLRFGLIELDPETGERTPRPSADLYADIAQGNALTPEMVDAYAPELRPTLLPG